MCNAWKSKFMACGHIAPDDEIVSCANYDPYSTSSPPCQIWTHPPSEVRPYAPGEGWGDCESCATRKTLNDQWVRAMGSCPDSKYLQYLQSRNYLFMLDWVSMDDKKTVQDLIIRMWIDYGEVTDVNIALKGLGYEVDEMPMGLARKRRRVGEDGQEQEQEITPAPSEEWDVATPRTRREDTDDTDMRDPSVNGDGWRLEAGEATDWLDIGESGNADDGSMIRQSIEFDWASSQNDNEDDVNMHRHSIDNDLASDTTI
ncbi:uncharacterized protein GGS25DRAFT_242163 [Hypoxylon fragiforme]|uniref:uncharacterized protein n=1 Tax=Hypoxylon fragiforme TaxID=63214 RepID=UPI0020C6AE6D|nr:uncharacterized protein GGS25DRAFT_242163 [Hypoxylon fragiforme]KAI2610002.1 hypothetical protein GGS25DRAFT_242163 [Hypoxylon fragiforme]